MIRSTSVALAFAAASALSGGAQRFTVARHDIGGEGGTDYVTAEPGTGRVFVSRSTHVMVVDGPTGQRARRHPRHAAHARRRASPPKWKHGFTTNAGDSTRHDVRSRRH